MIADISDGHEVRKQARRRAAVPPGYDLVVLVEPGFEAFRRHGVIEAVPDVVFAGPHHFDRRAVHRLGQERRFDGEVPFRLAAKAAAQQRVMQGDVLRIEAEPLGDIVRAPPGDCTDVQISSLPSVMRAVAEGGSMVACARCGE